MHYKNNKLGICISPHVVHRTLEICQNVVPTRGPVAECTLLKFELIPHFLLTGFAFMNWHLQYSDSKIDASE